MVGLTKVGGLCLNPHVVGRFFRVFYSMLAQGQREVLIPMWWGGFSETLKEADSAPKELS